MVIILSIIAVLILMSVIHLQRFMRNMAIAESELLRELMEIKGILKRINEKQL